MDCSFLKKPLCLTNLSTKVVGLGDPCGGGFLNLFYIFFLLMYWDNESKRDLTFGMKT